MQAALASTVQMAHVSSASVSQSGCSETAQLRCRIVSISSLVCEQSLSQFGTNLETVYLISLNYQWSRRPTDGDIMASMQCTPNRPASMQSFRVGQALPQARGRAAVRQVGRSRQQVYPLARTTSP